MTAQLSRERLEEKLLEHIKHGGDSEEETMIRMLLAGMDAKSRKLFTCTGCGAEGLDEPLESKCHCNEDGAHWVQSVVFTAPPAPVAVPDEREAFEAFMEEKFKDSIDRKRVLNGDQGYFAWDMIVAWIVWQGRAAMLKAGPVTAATVPDGWKLVPVDPTEAMLNDADAYRAITLKDIWSALLAAAPAAPDQEV